MTSIQPTSPGGSGAPPGSGDLLGRELSALVRTVFAPRPEDQALAILIDLPDRETGDREAWRERRQLAGRWRDELNLFARDLGLAIRFFQYRNVGANNADLPDRMWPIPIGMSPADHIANLDPARAVRTESVFERHQLLIALTELSATAPLKVAARQYGFRAATMPGFGPKMLDALRLDWSEVDRRVRWVAEQLEKAERAEVQLCADAAVYHLVLDLRHRSAHASGGLLRDSGVAGNLPSGEAYIVPYEGERSDDPSRSQGELPVEHADGLVIYTIEGNRAVSVRAATPADEAAAQREAAALETEPAYANLAELGVGVLGDLGIKPIGSVLLDEKLGLHIAFGRSDHFGGTVGPEDFSSPRAVVHIDRVYLPELQPRVKAERVDLFFEDGERLELLRDGKVEIPSAPPAEEAAPLAPPYFGPREDEADALADSGLDVGSSPPVSPDATKKRPGGCGYALLVVVLGLVGFACGMIPGALLLGVSEGWSLTGVLLGSQLGLFAAALLCLRLAGVPWRRWYRAAAMSDQAVDERRVGATPGVILIGCALLGAGVFAFNMVATARLFPLVDNGAYAIELARVLEVIEGTIGWWGLAVLVGLLPPIAEETFFRGALLGGLRRRLPVGVAVLVTAMVFALFHWQPIHALVALGLGLAAGFAVVWTGTLWSGIVVHAVNNLLAVLVGRFAGEELSALPWPWLVPAVGSVALGGALLLGRSITPQARLRFRPGDRPI